jgi:hypothetical protein
VAVCGGRFGFGGVPWRFAEEDLGSMAFRGGLRRKFWVRWRSVAVCGGRFGFGGVPWRFAEEDLGSVAFRGDLRRKI